MAKPSGSSYPPPPPADETNNQQPPPPPPPPRQHADHLPSAAAAQTAPPPQDAGRSAAPDASVGAAATFSAGGGGILVGGGAGCSSRSVDVSAILPQKRKMDPNPDEDEDEPDAEPEPIKCGVCQRVFSNFIALCRHHRSHPDRGWRGSFPPSGPFASLRGQKPVPPPTPPPQHPQVRGRLASRNIDLNRRPRGERALQATTRAADRKNSIDLNEPPTADDDKP